MLRPKAGAPNHLHGGFVVNTKNRGPRCANGLAEQPGRRLPEVAEAIALGAARPFPTDVAVALTGIVGAATDENGDPVGLVGLAVVPGRSPR